MGLVETFAKAHQDTINDNPVEVLIRREGKVRNDSGGFTDVKEFVGLVRGRLYEETTGRAQTEQTPVQGIIEVQPRWGFMFPLQMQAVDPVTGAGLVLNGEPVLTSVVVLTDVESPDVTYLFDHPLMGRMELVNMYPNQDQGEVWGWRGECERKN